MVRADPILENWRWTVIDEDDGLKGTVLNLIEDRDGNVWVGTSEGVQKYDGINWTTYTTEDGLVHNRVRSLMQARDGSMWLGTSRGISVLSFGETGEAEWTTHTFDDGSNYIAPGRGFVETRDGTIWAGFFGPRRGAPGALRRYSEGRWTTVEPPVGPKRPIVFGLYEASDGVLYFGTFDGILRYDGEDWSLEPASAPTGFAEGPDGSIWTTTYESPRLVLQYEPSTRAWKRHPAHEVGISRPLWRWSDPDGTIWVSGGNQLTRYRDGKWHAYPRMPADRKLGGATVGMRGRDGITWMFSIFGSAIVRFRGEAQPVTYAHRDSLLVGPEGPDGSAWFASAAGVVRHVNGDWLRYTGADGGIDGGIRTVIRAEDGSIWAVGTHRGRGAVARFSSGQWTRYTERDGNIDAPRFLLDTEDGNVWSTGHHRGRAAVSRYDGKTWERIVLPNGKPTQRFDRRVGDLGNTQTWGVIGGYAASDGTLWFRERANGVHRYDPQAEPADRWMHFVESDSLISGRTVYDLAEWPEGTLWAGTEAGMHRIELAQLPEDRTWMRKTDFPVSNPKFNGFVTRKDGLWVTPIFNRDVGVFRYAGSSWGRFRYTDGLPDDAIRTIHQTSDGALWFIGMAGISRYQEGEGWLRLGFTDGLPSFDAGYIYQRLTETRDGVLWVDVDGKHVLRLQYPARQAPETFLRPAVESVTSAGNILIRWHGTTSWNETPADELLYRWRLDQGDWKETEDTDITLTSLEPGAHRFEVYAVSPTTLVDTSPAFHAFTVDAPWWRDPRFVVPISALFLGVMVQTVRITRRDRALISANEALSDANNELFRVNQEISAQSERKSAFLASMSHELRTPMNAIKGFTNLVIRRGKDQPWERSEANLLKVSQASDHLLAQIDDLLDLSKIEAGKMEVDVKRFDVKEMIEYCVATVSPLVLEGVALRMDVGEGVGEVETDEQRVRQMVINLLSNAVKFTEAGSVTVSVQAVEGKARVQGSATLRVADEFASQTRGSGFRKGENNPSDSQVAGPASRYADGTSATRSHGGDTLIISVSDTGKGIPAAEIPTLFDEYRQVSGQSESEVQRGTGLGLSITKRFAELLGGMISVESEVGKGSTFMVRIPATYGDDPPSH